MWIYKSCNEFLYASVILLLLKFSGIVIPGDINILRASATCCNFVFHKGVILIYLKGLDSVYLFHQNDTRCSTTVATIISMKWFPKVVLIFISSSWRNIFPIYIFFLFVFEVSVMSFLPVMFVILLFFSYVVFSIY